MVLSTRNATIGYVRKRQPPVVLATNISLDLRPGRLTALLGPNGAGKSTLIRTITGFQAPLEGEITLQGTPLPQWGRQDLSRRLGLMLSEPVHAGNLSAYETVALGRIPYTGWLGNLGADDHDAICRALKVTGVYPLRNRKLHLLSDGEKQKVMLARVLAQETPVIILDEPAAHLDLVSRIEMVDLLWRLTRDHGKGILFSSHDLELALHMADYLWLMDGRGVLHTGFPEDLALRGNIGELYAKEGLGFETETGKIRLPVRAGTGSVWISGPGPASFWARKALERTGYTVLDSAVPGIPGIRMTGEGMQTEWQLQHGEQVLMFGSLEKLIEALRSFSL